MTDVCNDDSASKRWKKDVTVIYSFRVSGDVLVDFRGLQLFGLKRTGTFSGLNAVCRCVSPTQSETKKIVKIRMITSDYCSDYCR